MRRIGVFGGSFDPVHLAHLIVAEVAAERLALDQVRFIPTAHQPLKPEGHSASTRHRVAMLHLALQETPRFVVDLREVHRGGMSYTVDTLAELHRDFPEDELFLMVGADVARDLAKWKDTARIADLAHVVALSRAGVEAPVGSLIAQTVTVPAVDISASGVREAVRDGRPIGELVPDRVAEYIRHHRLYHDE